MSELNQVIKENLKVYDYTRNDYPVQINNNGIYELECRNGHKIHSLLSNKKYEVLFESGILAYTEGYYIESVTVISSSLENFVEYCILLMTFDSNFKFYSDVTVDNKEQYENYIREYNKVKDEYENNLKRYRKKSGIRLKAFYSLYHAIVGEPLQEINYQIKIDGANKNLRNEVAHNGYIPSQNESLGYLKYVFDYINNVAKKLTLKLNKKTFHTVDVVLFEKLIERGLKQGNACEFIPMFLNDVFNSEKTQTFEEKMRAFQSMRDISYGKVRY